MPHTNVKSAWVDGDLYFHDKAGAEICHLDGTNRRLVVPSGSTLQQAGTMSLTGARQTIANAAVISDAETIAGVLYQDASGGAVTMTTRTGTQLASAFPDLATGEFVRIHCASNHATNTSTIAGGTDVSLVGSGAVINTGGQFLLIKTAATTFDLVRVG